MTRILWVLGLLVALSGCSGCNGEKSEIDEWTTIEDDLNKPFPESFKSDTIAIRNLFDQPAFENDTLKKLLEELKICNPDVEAPFNINRPPCSPRYYKFFKYKSDMPWNEGFALEIRAGVEDFPLRRLIIFQRIQGKLTKIQGFVANLAEMHTTPSGYNDLMLLFRDQEAGSFVVKYRWAGEEYRYISVEAIDGYLVKKERQDSLSIVVEKRLIDNSMFF
jgi:hypothetical protein